MIKKSEALIITFKNTTEAMAVEKFCSENGLPGRIIPLPREISAGCGLSWKAKTEDKEVLISAFNEAKLEWQQCHIIEI